MWGTRTLRTPANEDFGTLAENDPLTGYEPNDIDNYHISETTEIFIQESSSDGRPLNLHDSEFDDHTIGRALSSPLFDASRRRAYHSQEEGLSSSLSSSVGHERTGRPVFDEFGSLISNVRENPRRDSENEQIRILLERQKEQTLADYRAEIEKHEFQADYDRRNIQKLNEVIECQRGENYRAHQGDEQLRRDQQLTHGQLLEQNRDLREAHEKSLNEMEELKRFQGSTFDTIARRRLIEDRDTILELTGKIQELQNEIHCMNDSRDFQDAQSIRSGQSHVTSQLVFFPPHPDPGGMLSRSLGMPSRNNGPPSIRDTHGISGNVFADQHASSSAHYPQESNPWVSNVSEHTSPHVISESQTPVQDQRCQSGPSARNSVVPSEGGFSKNYGADQQRLQISDLHFDKFPTPATFACWKIRFKTEVCTCSQFPTEAMQWIKEVELVDSVDELRSSSSTRGISMPNFEVLDARIASALNKIIHNSQFKRRISLEEQKAQKEDRFLRGRQIAYLIYDYFRVTGSHDSVENYADLFTISLRNDDIQEFDSKWDGILLSMTKIPPDDILEGLYKLRIRESEKLKTVLELYDLETHQKKLGPDYHRLKAMVKRSIEQEIRNKNFGARSGNFEKTAVVKNQGTKQREQRTLGDCWQWETNGQCVKGDNCSFRHDINKCAKSTQPNPSPSSSWQQSVKNASRSPGGRSPSRRMFRLPCKAYLKGTCCNSFCEKWHPPVCLFYKSKNGCRFGEKCSYLHRQVEEQPSKRSRKIGDKIAVAMLKRHEQHQRTEKTCFGRLLIKYTTIGLRISGYGASEVIIDFAEELKHTETNPMCKIRHSRCTSR